MSDIQISLEVPTSEETVDPATREAELEYQQVNEWWRKISEMRRHDLAAFTAIQGAAVTVIGDHLLRLQAHHLLISLVAFVVIIVGYNNERRLSAFLEGVITRGVAIEQAAQMTLLTHAKAHMLRTPGIASTTRTFSAFYVALAVSWVVIWLVNGLTLVQK